MELTEDIPGQPNTARRHDSEGVIHPDLASGWAYLILGGDQSRLMPWSRPLVVKKPPGGVVCRAYLSPRAIGLSGLSTNLEDIEVATRFLQGDLP